MQITRTSIDSVKGPADWFTGHVYVDHQTVFVTEGVGLCQRRGGSVEEIIRPGDRVLFEADDEHWHGAAPNRLMVHVAINEGDEDHAVVHWMTPVTDEEYAAAPPV